MVFGTLMFSSLTFISVFDFLNYVFWRYIAAATTCRIYPIGRADRSESRRKEVLAGKTVCLGRTDGYVNGDGRGAEYDHPSKPHFLRYLFGLGHA